MFCFTGSRLIEERGGRDGVEHRLIDVVGQQVRDHDVVAGIRLERRRGDGAPDVRQHPFFVQDLREPGEHVPPVVVEPSGLGEERGAPLAFLHPGVGFP